MLTSRSFVLGSLLAALALAGCAGEPASEPRRYEVRGEFIMSRFEGQAMLVDHEAIADVMGAMRMDFRLQDATEIQGLAPGDKIRFTYVVTDDGAWAEGVEKLPPDTPLELAGGETDPAPAE